MKIAEAYVEIRAKDAGAKAEAKKIVDGIGKEKAEIPVTAKDETGAPIATIKQRIQGLTKERATLVLNAATQQAEAEIRKIDGQLAKVTSGNKREILLKARDEASKNLNEVQEELKELEGDSKKRGQNITRNLARLFTAGIFVDQVGKAISAASNLEQQVGGTKAVFQEAEGVINGFAETSAEQFGLSERAFRELTSQIGASLKGYGLSVDEAAEKSVELTGLGGDLAATFGGTVPEAVAALGSTLRGEFDPAERYGIALSAAKVEAKALELGLLDLDGKMTASGKVQATLALITEQTADTQGQFAREAETAGGQTERLKAKFEDMQAEIGSNLLPVFSRVVEMLSKTAEFFGSLPGPVQTAIVAMAGIAIVAGPIKNVISGFTGITAAIKKIGPQAVATGGIIAAAAGIYLLYSNRKADAEATTREFVDALKAEQSGQEAASTAAIAAKLATEENVAALDALGISAGDAARFIRGENVPAIEEMIDRFKEAGAFWKGPFAEDQARVLRDLSENTGISESAIGGLIDTLNTSRESFSGAEREVAAFNEVQNALGLSSEGAATGVEDVNREVWSGIEAWRQLGDGTVEASGGLDEVGESAAGAREPLRDVGQTAEELADSQLSALEDASDDAADAAKGLADALNEVFGGAVDLQGASDALRDNVAELEQALEDNGKTLDQNTEKGRLNREQMRNSVKGVQEYITKLAESGATSEDVEGQYSLLREQLVQQAQQFGLTRGDAEAYVDQLGLTPDRIDTAVNLNNVDAARELIRSHIERLGAIPPSKLTTINAAADRGDISAVEQALNDLARDRIMTVQIRSTGGVYVPPGVNRAAAEGAFVRGGSADNVSWRLAEHAGRRGDEVILPLGNESRLAQLLAMPEVKDRVAAAMGETTGGGVAVIERSGAGISIGTIYAQSPLQVRQELERMQWQQRMAGRS